jgi:hypothetical protein
MAGSEGVFARQGCGRLADKGLFAILINAALLGVALLAKKLSF